MTKYFNRLVFAGAIFLMAFALTACGGGGSGSGISSSGGTTGTTGTLELGLIDAPVDYQHVWVTIQEISVHQASGDVDVEDPGWIQVLDFTTVGGERIDLLAYQDPDQPFDLGVAELEEGDYTQLRLKLMNNDDLAPGAEPYNYVVVDGEDIPLKVPSGSQTGIKIVKGFHIDAQGATALLLDFDAEKSVVQAGKSGNWLLKPTIKVVDTVTNSIVGFATTPGGASVSAQQIDQVYDENGMIVDGVEVVSGTDSDAISGDYQMYVPLGIYNVVATMTDYLPDCQEVDATQYGVHEANFDLASAGSQGTLTVSVSGLPETDDSATFSIRQDNGDCGIIEVASVNVANDASSEPITLPVGTYQVLVTPGELAPRLFENVVIGEGPNQLDAVY